MSGRVGGAERCRILCGEVAMSKVEPGRFTVGVFKDVLSAEKGIDALKGHGFPAVALSIVTKQEKETSTLVERVFGRPAESRELPGIGAVVAVGSLVEALEGPERDLSRVGLSAAMRRVGFQAHDGQIFEALTLRGGVLVAVRGEARAADALATLHNYGGGNAAIGAWTGRV
jgi:hypothetical protein